MAAVEELKECLGMSIESVLDRLNDRLHEGMDGIDYLCVQVDRTWSREPQPCIIFPQ